MINWKKLRLIDMAVLSGYVSEILISSERKERASDTRLDFLIDIEKSGGFNIES
jgi:hypothetical protein